jgi:hypothetical protein
VITLGTGPTFSETLQEHKAFTWYAPLGIFAFPVSSGGWWSEFDGFMEPFNGLFAYHVSPQTGFKRLAVVNHRDLDDSGEWFGSYVRRSFIMVDEEKTPYLYSISESGLKINRLDGSGDEVARVRF